MRAKFLSMNRINLEADNQEERLLLNQFLKESRKSYLRISGSTRNQISYQTGRRGLDCLQIEVVE